MTDPLPPNVCPSEDEFWEAYHALALQTATGIDDGSDSGEIALVFWANKDNDEFAARERDLRSRNPEACAAVMVEFAEATDDPSAWQAIGEAMTLFIDAGRSPPIAFSKAICDAFARWRKGEEIAVVFGEKRGKGRLGRPSDGLNARCNTVLKDAMRFVIRAGNPGASQEDVSLELDSITGKLLEPPTTRGKKKQKRK